MKTKKLMIVVSLVEEAQEEANETIKKEIIRELSKDLPKIPWCKKWKKSKWWRIKPLIRGSRLVLGFHSTRNEIY